MGVSDGRGLIPCFHKPGNKLCLLGIFNVLGDLRVVEQLHNGVDSGLKLIQFLNNIFTLLTQVWAGEIGVYFTMVIYGRVDL